MSYVRGLVHAAQSWTGVPEPLRTRHSNETVSASPLNVHVGVVSLVSAAGRPGGRASPPRRGAGAGGGGARGTRTGGWGRPGGRPRWGGCRGSGGGAGRGPRGRGGGRGPA